MSRSFAFRRQLLGRSLGEAPASLPDPISRENALRDITRLTDRAGTALERAQSRATDARSALEGNEPVGVLAGLRRRLSPGRAGLRRDIERVERHLRELEAVSELLVAARGLAEGARTKSDRREVHYVLQRTRSALEVELQDSTGVRPSTVLTQVRERLATGTGRSQTHVDALDAAREREVALVSEVVGRQVEPVIVGRLGRLARREGKELRQVAERYRDLGRMVERSTVAPLSEPVLVALTRTSIERGARPKRVLRLMEKVARETEGARTSIAPDGAAILVDTALALGLDAGSVVGRYHEMTDAVRRRSPRAWRESTIQDVARLARLTHRVSVATVEATADRYVHVQRLLRKRHSKRNAFFEVERAGVTLTETSLHHARAPEAVVGELFLVFDTLRSRAQDAQARGRSGEPRELAGPQDVARLVATAARFDAQPSTLARQAHKLSQMAPHLDYGGAVNALVNGLAAKRAAGAPSATTLTASELAIAAHVQRRLGGRPHDDWLHTAASGVVEDGLGGRFALPQP
jgi:hypothetical protein